MAGKKAYNCTLTFGGNTIGKAQNVDLDMTADEEETTTRDSAGWKEFLQGLKEWTAPVDNLWVPDNTGLVAIRDAFLNGTQVGVAFKDEDDYGFSGNCIVTSLKMGQPLAEAVTMPVTLRGTGALTPTVPSS